MIGDCHFAGFRALFMQASEDWPREGRIADTTPLQRYNWSRG